MNKENSLIKTAESSELQPVEERTFKGYSIEELRYQRAMVALKKEFCKAKILSEVHQIRKHTLFGGKDSGKVSRAGGMVTKLLSGLNYLDYAMLGVTLFNSGKKILSIFRGIRKK